MKKVSLLVLVAGFTLCSCSQDNSSRYGEKSPRKSSQGWDGPGWYKGVSWFETEGEFNAWRDGNRVRTQRHWQSQNASDQNSDGTNQGCCKKH